jgi:hypothetical protein
LQISILLGIATTSDRVSRDFVRVPSEIKIPVVGSMPKIETLPSPCQVGKLPTSHANQLRLNVSGIN